MQSFKTLLVVCGAGVAIHFGNMIALSGDSGQRIRLMFGNRRVDVVVPSRKPVPKPKIQSPARTPIPTEVSQPVSESVRPPQPNRSPPWSKTTRRRPTSARGRSRVHDGWQPIGGRQSGFDNGGTHRAGPFGDRDETRAKTSRFEHADHLLPKNWPNNDLRRFGKSIADREPEPQPAPADESPTQSPAPVAQAASPVPRITLPVTTAAHTATAPSQTAVPQNATTDEGWLKFALMQIVGTLVGLLIGLTSVLIALFVTLRKFGSKLKPTIHVELNHPPFPVYMQGAPRSEPQQFDTSQADLPQPATAVDFDAASIPFPSVFTTFAEDRENAEQLQKEREQEMFKLIYKENRDLQEQIERQGSAA